MGVHNTSKIETQGISNIVYVSCVYLCCQQGIPYIDMIDKQGPWLVGGSISVLGREALAYHDGLDEYR